MTTIHDRPNTGLLVLDVQHGALAGCPQRDQVIANIQVLLDRARRAGAPVIWTRHGDDHLVSGTEEWELIAELQPIDGEAVVDKGCSDAFEDTELEEVLAAGRIGRLVVAGAQTDECVRSTLHGAVVRGYDATLVSDGHTTEDQREWGNIAPEQVITHTNLYWSHHALPGRSGGTVATANAEFPAPI